jgi:hypothetical protein
MAEATIQYNSDRDWAFLCCFFSLLETQLVLAPLPGTKVLNCIGAEIVGIGNSECRHS